MGIRIIHGNGDLIGAAAEGIGQGVENYQAGKQKQAETARAEQVAANLAEQLRMDQETHAQGVQLFNQRMFDTEATQNWRKAASSFEGPGKYQQMRESLAQSQMSEPARAQALEVLDMEEMAEAREQSAMGYRGRIGELMRQNQQFAEMSPVLQGLMDPAVLQDTPPEELPALLQSVEGEVRMLRQQARDDAATFQMGERLNTLANDPNLGYAMQEQIPRIIDGMADRYPPQAMNNLLAGLTGEVPMSRLMDGGATEAATRDYLMQRAMEDPRNKAAADAANMGLGGGGQAGPSAGEQFGQGGAVPVGDPESFGRVPAPAPTGDEFSDQLAAKTYETRVTEGERLLEDGPTTEEEWGDTVRYAHDKLMEIDAQAKANGGLVPMAWLPKEERRDGYRKLREYGRTLAGKPNARALLAAKAQELGLLMDPEADKDFLMTIVAEPDSAFRARLSALAESVDPRPRLKEVVNKKAYNRDNTGKLDDVRSSLRAEFPDSPYLSEKGQVDERAIIKAQEERQRKRNKRLFGGN